MSIARLCKQATFATHNIPYKRLLVGTNVQERDGQRLGLTGNELDRVVWDTLDLDARDLGHGGGLEEGLLLLTGLLHSLAAHFDRIVLAVHKLRQFFSLTGVPEPHANHVVAFVSTHCKRYTRKNERTNERTSCSE